MVIVPVHALVAIHRLAHLCLADSPTGRTQTLVDTALGSDLSRWPTQWLCMSTNSPSCSRGQEQHLGTQYVRWPAAAHDLQA